MRAVPSRKRVERHDVNPFGDSRSQHNGEGVNIYRHKRGAFRRVFLTLRKEIKARDPSKRRRETQGRRQSLAIECVDRYKIVADVRGIGRGTGPDSKKTITDRIAARAIQPSEFKGPGRRPKGIRNRPPT